MFDSLRGGTVARNVLHGLEVLTPGASSPTRLHITYQPPIDAHKIRDFIGKHPRVFLPIFIFLLGSLTYTVRLKSRFWEARPVDPCGWRRGGSVDIAKSLTNVLQIFDPIRSLMVQAKMQDWFSVRSTRAHNIHFTVV